MSLVVRHSQGAEALVKLYEAKLCEEDTVNAEIKAIEMVMSTLKVGLPTIASQGWPFKMLFSSLNVHLMCLSGLFLIISSLFMPETLKVCESLFELSL